MTERSTASETTPAGPVGALPRGEFDGLRIGRELGSGTNGVVLEALQVATGRMVAVKFLRAGTGASPEEQARFRREVQAAAQLDSPHIARLYASGWHAGVPYLVMELVHGLLLMEHVREQSPTLIERLALFDDICCGVAHAHARQVIHRDLKPDNIMVDGYGRARVLDFSTALLRKDVRLTADGAFVGTLSHAAPEQVSGGHVDERTDVHALGLLLHELITGRPARDASAGMARLVQDILQPAVLRPSLMMDGVSEELDAIVRQATALDPDARYATVEALRDDVRRHLQGWPVRARRPSPLRVAHLMLRRNPRLSVVVGASVALLACLSIVSTIAARQARQERDRTRIVAARAIELLSAGTSPPDTLESREARYEALMRFQRVGLDPHLERSLLRDMADMNAAAGEWERAIGLRKLALLIAPGGSRPSVEQAIDLEAIARAELARGRASAALRDAGHAWSAVRREPDRARPESVLVRATLARALQATGRLEEASGHLFASARHLQEVARLRPGLDLEVALALAELDFNPVQRIEMLQRVLRSTAVPNHDQRRAPVLEQLARMQLSKGDVRAGLQSARAAVGIRASTGPQTSGMALSLGLLAQACSQAGYPEEAAMHAEQSHVRLSRRHGPDSVEARRALELLASIQDAAGLTAEASRSRGELARMQALDRFVAGLGTDPLQALGAWEDGARELSPASPVTGLHVRVTRVGDMASRRAHHTATRLRDGSVLTCGGIPAKQEIAMAECERYVPTDGAYVDAGRMKLPRAAHFALGMQGGEVVVGGGRVTSLVDANPTVEVRDPSSAAFSILGELSVPRLRGALAVTSGQDTACILGGVARGEFGESTNVVEEVHLGSRTLRPAGSMSLSRADCAACRLSEGGLVVVGGRGWFAGEAVNEVRVRTEETWAVGATHQPVALPPGFRVGATTAAAGIGAQCVVVGEDGSVRIRGRAGWSDVIVRVPITGSVMVAAMTPSVMLACSETGCHVVDIVNGSAGSVPEMTPFYAEATITPLGDGCVLAAGGVRGDEPLASASAYRVCVDAAAD